MLEVRFLPQASRFFKKLKDKTNYQLTYSIEYQNNKIIVVIMAGTCENFYNELKKYMK